MNTLILLAVSFVTAVMLTGLLRTAAPNSVSLINRWLDRRIPYRTIGGGLAVVLPVFIASAMFLRGSA